MSLTYSGWWKRRHPEKTREWNARDNAKRPDRKRTGTCEQCGGPRRGDTLARYGDRLCATCRDAK